MFVSLLGHCTMQARRPRLSTWPDADCTTIPFAAARRPTVAPGLAGDPVLEVSSGLMARAKPCARFGMSG